jgi:hypothetical protein
MSTSVAISLDPTADKRWLVAQATGELRLDETLTFLRTARSKGESRQAGLLFDARGATTQMTESDVEEAVEKVAAMRRVSGERQHVALVADDDMLYARMLLYEMRCAQMELRLIRVFRLRPDAEQWLATMLEARHFR